MAEEGGRSAGINGITWSSGGKVSGVISMVSFNSDGEGTEDACKGNEVNVPGVSFIRLDLCIFIYRIYMRKVTESEPDTAKNWLSGTAWESSPYIF